MGEFELALVFYHRGKKLRGDVKEFQLGINKAQEAIDNCVGGEHFYKQKCFKLEIKIFFFDSKDPHTVKLEVKGDLSYFEKPDEVIQLEIMSQRLNSLFFSIDVFLFSLIYFCFFS